MLQIYLDNNFYNIYILKNKGKIMFKCKDCKFLNYKQYFILDDKIDYECKITTDWAADSEVTPEMHSCNYFKPIHLLKSLKIAIKMIFGWFR